MISATSYLCDISPVIPQKGSEIPTLRLSLIGCLLPCDSREAESGFYTPPFRSAWESLTRQRDAACANIQGASKNRCPVTILSASPRWIGGVSGIRKCIEKVVRDKSGSQRGDRLRLIVLLPTSIIREGRGFSPVSFGDDAPPPQMRRLHDGTAPLRRCCGAP